MSLHKQISLLPKDIISKIILYYGCINKIDHSLKKSIKVYSALLLANYYMMRTFSRLKKEKGGGRTKKARRTNKIYEK